MTDLFERGDCFYFAGPDTFRGLHFVVLRDEDSEVRFADTGGRTYRAEVGNGSLHVWEEGCRLASNVSVDMVHFE